MRKTLVLAILAIGLTSCGFRTSQAEGSRDLPSAVPSTINQGAAGDVTPPAPDGDYCRAVRSASKLVPGSAALDDPVAQAEHKAYAAALVPVIASAPEDVKAEWTVVHRVEVSLSKGKLPSVSDRSASMRAFSKIGNTTKTCRV